jgi:hypothetical protein
VERRSKDCLKPAQKPILALLYGLRHVGEICCGIEDLAAEEATKIPYVIGKPEDLDRLSQFAGSALNGCVYPMNTAMFVRAAVIVWTALGIS